QATDDAMSRLANSGVFVSVAAGQPAEPPQPPRPPADACTVSPAGSPAAFTVAASDASDRAWSSSNWGSCVSLYAPGVGIQFDWPSNVRCASAPPGNIYCMGDGTSTSAAYVGGVAAVYKSEFGDVSTSALRTWLIHNAASGLISNAPSYDAGSCPPDSG